MKQKSTHNPTHIANKLYLFFISNLWVRTCLVGSDFNSTGSCWGGWHCEESGCEKWKCKSACSGNTWYRLSHLLFSEFCNARLVVEGEGIALQLCCDTRHFVNFPNNGFLVVKLSSCLFNEWIVYSVMAGNRSCTIEGKIILELLRFPLLLLLSHLLPVTCCYCDSFQFQFLSLI